MEQQQNTIEDAIVQVLKRHPDGLTPKEIYDKIVEQKLYHFHAEEPVSVVDHTLRKSLIGVNIEITKKEEKLFKETADGKYKLKDQ